MEIRGAQAGPGRSTCCRFSSRHKSGGPIESGLIQRAQLLNLLLEDLYGSQEIIKTGRLPAELIYANPGFLRPLAGSATAFGELPPYPRCRSRALA